MGGGHILSKRWNVGIHLQDCTKVQTKRWESQPDLFKFDLFQLDWHIQRNYEYSF
jgi:hypothetical protein